MINKNEFHKIWEMILKKDFIKLDKASDILTLFTKQTGNWIRTLVNLRRRMVQNY